MQLVIGNALFFFLVLIAVPSSNGLDDAEYFLKETVGLLDDCGGYNIVTCMKEKALRYIDQLPGTLDFGGGLKITPTENYKRSSRYVSSASLPDEPRSRDSWLNAALMERAINYLSSHTIQYRMPDNTMNDMKRAFEDDESNQEEHEEGRKKKKKGMQMMYLLQMKAAAVGAIMLKVIGIVAFKALMLAKLALAIATMIGLKKLIDDKHHHTSTYEVVAPHYDDHGHYLDRSFKSAQEIAYNAYSSKRSN